MKKYSQIPPLPSIPPVIQRYRVSNLSGGLQFQVNSKDLPPGFSQDMDKVRFWMNGISPAEKVNALGTSISGGNRIQCFCNHREDLAASPWIRSRTFCATGEGTKTIYRFDTGVTDDWVTAGSIALGAGYGAGPGVLRSMINTLIYCEAYGSANAYYWDGTTTWTAITGTNAISARDVIYFADRALFIGSQKHPQFIAWSASGDPTDLSSAGSGQIDLVGSGSLPTDQLIGAATVGGSVAIFRQRSIYRGFRTGSSALAIGAVPWISAVGCQIQHTIQQAGNGAIFLGDDWMVYYLSETSLDPIGKNVRDMIIRSTKYAGSSYGCYSAYDYKHDEYYLTLKDANYGTFLLVFELGHWARTGEERWRIRLEGSATPTDVVVIGSTEEDIT